MTRYAQGVDPEQRYAHLKAVENWFRCDRCGFAWPESRRVEQDGLDLCRDNCAKRWGKTDRDKFDTKETARLAREEARTKEPDRPFKSDAWGVPGVEAISPEVPILLPIGGAAVEVIHVGM